MSESVEASKENSEHEESFETKDESNVKSDNERCESPTPKSGVEPAKPKRRGRRGKKRKQRKDSSAAFESEAHEDHEAGDSKDWKSDENMDLEDPKIGGFMDTVMVRPINVPKAPENYNTFIMDEHDECRLYMSFETPDPYGKSADEQRERDRAITDPFEDAAYIDIDYEYESPQDFQDNVAYYDKEFEESYKNNRFDELVRLTREELVAGIQTLESQLRALSEELVRENPGPVLEKLQGELLEQQEKHLELKGFNTKLSQLVSEDDAGSAPGESPANSQTLSSLGFSPSSDLVSPSHTIESKCELVLSEQSPRKGWSPYSHGGETPDIDDDAMLFATTPSKSTDTNIDPESIASAKEGDCCLSQMSDLKVDNSLNSSSEDGESPNLRRLSESGFEAVRTTFHSDLVCSPKPSPEDVPNSVSTLEELNSLTV